MPIQRVFGPTIWDRMYHSSVWTLVWCSAPIGLVLLFAVCCSQLVANARRQRDAVGAIETAGGFVEYGPDRVLADEAATHLDWMPRWLRPTFDVHYCATVSAVTLDEGCSDEVLAHVGRLKRLKSLGVFFAPVTDGGLIHLRGLSNLSELLLLNKHISDAGLEHLRGLAHSPYFS